MFTKVHASFPSISWTTCPIPAAFRWGAGLNLDRLPRLTRQQQAQIIGHQVICQLAFFTLIGSLFSCWAGNWEKFIFVSTHFLSPVVISTITAWNHIMPFTSSGRHIELLPAKSPSSTSDPWCSYWTGTSGLILSVIIQCFHTDGSKSVSGRKKTPHLPLTQT